MEGIKLDFDFIPLEDDGNNYNVKDEYENEYSIANDIQIFINEKLQFDKWKEAGGRYIGCIGECVSLQYAGGVGHYKAELSIWDATFNDAKLFVGWLDEYGVAFVDNVCVQKFNCFDLEPQNKSYENKDHRRWIIDFYLKNHRGI